MEGRRERKKERTRREIIKAARTLIGERGYAETTMAVVAHEADVAIGTLYNYYPSKDALLLGMWQDATARLLDDADERVAAAGAVPAARCAALLSLFASAGDLFPQPIMQEVLAVSMGASRDMAAQLATLDVQLMTRLAGLLSELSEAGSLSPEVDIEQATSLLYGIAMTQLLAYAHGAAADFSQVENNILVQVQIVFRGMSNG